MHTARDALAMLDDRALCQVDRRLDYFEVQAGSESGRGRLPVVVVKEVESFNGHYREYLGLSSRGGAVALIGGGLGRMWSGSTFTALEETPRRQLLAELVRGAMDRASEITDTIVAPFLSVHDLPAYLDAVPSARPSRRGLWCTLEIGAVSDIADFVQRQEKRYRKKWKRDARDTAAQGLEHDWVPITDTTVEEAAPGISSVSRLNGIDESVELVSWRLANYVRRPGRHFFIRTWQRDELVAHTLCRTWDDALDAHTIGIAEKSDLDRRTVYHAASLLGPLGVAIGMGAQRLELGFGHETPKLQRGCVGEELYFVDLQAAL